MRACRRPSLWRVLVWAVLILAVCVLVVSARLFVWPPSDRPARVDAVVALGGDPGQRRAAEAIRLARAGAADVVVVSLGGVPEDPCPRPTPRLTLICFRASPLDTRGEAEFVSRLAAARHWRSIIVVPERSQATRARMLFERCTDIRILMVPVTDPTGHLLYDVAYEWAALAKALVLVRAC